MDKFSESSLVKGMNEVTYQAYLRYWDERNGGNVSLKVDEEYLEAFDDIDYGSEIKYDLGFDARELSGNYFLVTGTGRYFRNITNRSDIDLGLVKISDDGKCYKVVWGFKDGGRPTSEFPSHLLSHIERLKVDPNHRAIFHCHPTNLMSLSFTQDLDEKKLSRLLWKMQAESIVVFPEGIGILPFMVPGTNDIGKLTSEKMSEFKAVLWANHGLFASGSSLDDAYGLIEVIEKSAMIYTTIMSQGGEIKQKISDRGLKEIANFFKVKPHEEFLD